MRQLLTKSDLHAAEQRLGIMVAMILTAATMSVSAILGAMIVLH